MHDKTSVNADSTEGFWEVLQDRVGIKDNDLCIELRGGAEE